MGIQAVLFYERKGELTMDYMEILKTIGLVIIGGLALYVECNKKIQKTIAEVTGKAVAFIKEAEEIYKDITKAGGTKKAWVVKQLYDLVPKPFNLIITEDMISQIVERTFVEVENYAKQQLDKQVDKLK